MEYVPMVVGAAGIGLILYSFGYFDFVAKAFAKKVVRDESQDKDVVSKFVEIRRMLVGEVDDATLAAVDKVILDAVSGAKKDEK